MKQLICHGGWLCKGDDGDEVWWIFDCLNSCCSCLFLVIVTRFRSLLSWGSYICKLAVKTDNSLTYAIRCSLMLCRSFVTTTYLGHVIYFTLFILDFYLFFFCCCRCCWYFGISILQISCSVLLCCCIGLFCNCVYFASSNTGVPVRGPDGYKGTDLQKLSTPICWPSQTGFPLNKFFTTVVLSRAAVAAALTIGDLSLWIVPSLSSVFLFSSIRRPTVVGCMKTPPLKGPVIVHNAKYLINSNLSGEKTQEHKKLVWIAQYSVPCLSWHHHMGKHIFTMTVLILQTITKNSEIIFLGQAFCFHFSS